MRKILMVLVLVLVSTTMVFAAGAGETASYPNKDINVYIFSSQGGGTDAWCRFLAPLMEEDLGVKIISTNMPGANGGTAAQKVWTSAHDGYTVLGASETSMFFGANNVAPTSDNWHFFIAAGSGGIIAVPTGSPYKTIQDLVAAAKANPKSVTIANSGQGKGWHTKAVTLEKAANVEFKHVPYNGSGPAITAMLSGETAAVSCSTGEISEYIRAGIVRPLVITEAQGETFAGWEGEVPAAAKLYPQGAFAFANMFQWLGFMLPKDTPTEAVERFSAAFKKAMANPKTAEFAKTQSARIFGLTGNDANTLAKNMEAVTWWMAQDLGIAKMSPESAGIPRP
ncbi:MAG: tripartite tricarboxylate transporter substrate binding protein [Sphaerochaeta sp.]|nr:tripartite tricarboxylate transporter substrate binding protein [Sphaerochaeta sp.]